MFPYRVDNPTRRTPVFAIGLISINVFLYLALSAAPEYWQVIWQFGFTPANPTVASTFSSLFLHGSWFHLLFNMWYLWLFGTKIEDIYGKAIFLVFYLLGGLSAALAHSWTIPAALDRVPAVGASGAISALLGAYCVLFPRARVWCCWGPWDLFSRFNVSAFCFLGLWFLGQLWSLWGPQPSGMAPIAFGAHIGGFVFGGLSSLLLKQVAVPPDALLLPSDITLIQAQQNFEEAMAAVDRKAHALEEESGKYRSMIEEHLRTGELEPAIRTYVAFERQALPGALPAESQKLLGDTLSDRGEKLLACQAYLRFLFTYTKHSDAAVVMAKIGLLQSREFGNFVAGRRFLQHAMKYRDRIVDPKLLQAVDSELLRIDQHFHDPASSGEDRRSQALALVTVWPDERLPEKQVIFKALESIGVIDSLAANPINLGVKLAYRATENLQRENGLLLQNLNSTEAKLAVDKLRALGITVAIFSHEVLNAFRSFHSVTEVSFCNGQLRLVADNKDSVQLRPCDIAHITLGQIPFAVATHALPRQRDLFEIDIGVFDVDDAQESDAPPITKIQVNRVLDVFTVDLQRYRINANLTAYVEGTRDSSVKKPFEAFIEDLVTFTGGEHMDECLMSFAACADWSVVNCPSLVHFDARGAREARLRLSYPTGWQVKDG